MVEILKSAHEEINICSNTAIIWHFKLVPVWVEICKHICVTLFLEFSGGLFWQDQRINCLRAWEMRKETNNNCVELDVLVKAFWRSWRGQTEWGRGWRVMAGAGSKALVLFPTTGVLRWLMDESSRACVMGPAMNDRQLALKEIRLWSRWHF